MAVVRALNVFDFLVVASDNRLVCVRHGRAPRAALTTSTSSRATAALEAVAWPSAQARSNDRQRCRHQSVHFMRVSSTHFVRAVAASRLWRSLIGLPPWCALRRSRLLPPSRRRPSRRTKLPRLAAQPLSRQDIYERTGCKTVVIVRIQPLFPRVSLPPPPSHVIMKVRAPACAGCRPRALPLMRHPAGAPRAK